MSKIIATLLLTAITLLPINAVPTSTPNLAPNEREVVVLFSGLLVFHFNKAKGSYEVGVVEQEGEHGHKFCIQQKGTRNPVCRADLEPGLGTKWTLSVNHTRGGSPRALGHNGQRRPDHEEGQFDFDWIVDLEGSEFHNKQLELRPGKLKPIIQLPKGELFTVYKSPDMLRWRGAKPSTPPVFGFVSETIGLRLTLRKNEVMRLTDDKTGAEILRVDYAPPSPGGCNELIEFNNVRKPTPMGGHPPAGPSDFSMYYPLFEGIDEKDKFDFDMNPGQPTHPEPAIVKNPLPKYKTCCDLKCTAILLSKRTKPLE